MGSSGQRNSRGKTLRISGSLPLLHSVLSQDQTLSVLPLMLSLLPVGDSKDWDSSPLFLSVCAVVGIVV